MNLVMVPPPFVVSHGHIMGGGIRADLYNQKPDVVVHPNAPDQRVAYGTIHNLPSGDTFHYDPMTDYKTWYGLSMHSKVMIVDDDAIAAKLWDRSEFNKWMETNIADLVLVQRSWPSWSLVFKSDLDYQCFTAWWSNVQKQEMLFLPVPTEYQGRNYEFIRELKEWCDENLVDAFEFINLSDRVRCHIRDPQEAVMFRLRWSEPNNNQV